MFLFCPCLRPLGKLGFACHPCPPRPHPRLTRVRCSLNSCAVNNRIRGALQALLCSLKSACLSRGGCWPPDCFLLMSSGAFGVEHSAPESFRVHLPSMSTQDDRGASLKETESEQSPPAPLPVTGRLLPGLGWGGVFFLCLLLLSSTGEGAPWQLAAPARFVDEKGRRSGLRPHVCVWLPAPGHVPSCLWPGCVSWPGLSGMYRWQVGRGNKAVLAWSP